MAFLVVNPVVHKEVNPVVHKEVNLVVHKEVNPVVHKEVNPVDLVVLYKRVDTDYQGN